MKHILVPLIACCAALLPVSNAGAKTYGGLVPKQTFTVKEKSSTKQVDFTPAVDVPVPAGIVNLSRGQKITFPIGVSLNFLKIETDGVSRTVTTVDYKLN